MLVQSYTNFLRDQSQNLIQVCLAHEHMFKIPNRNFFWREAVYQGPCASLFILDGV